MIRAWKVPITECCDGDKPPQARFGPKTVAAGEFVELGSAAIGFDETMDGRSHKKFVLM